MRVPYVSLDGHYKRATQRPNINLLILDRWKLSYTVQTDTCKPFRSLSDDFFFFATCKSKKSKLYECKIRSLNLAARERTICNHSAWRINFLRKQRAWSQPPGQVKRTLIRVYRNRESLSESYRVSFGARGSSLGVHDYVTSEETPQSVACPTGPGQG